MGLDNVTQKALASRLSRLCQVLTVCLAILVVLTLLSFFGAYNQFCEVLSHFVFFYFLLSLVGFSLAIWLRLKAAMAMASVVLVLNIARLGPQYLPVSHTPPPDAECIRIMAINCENRKSRDPEPIYKIACRENIDVVCFSEIDDGWRQRIHETFTGYRFEALFSNYGGIGMVSKLPAENFKILLAQFRNRPRVLGLLKLKNGQTISILSVHPSIPLNTPAFKGRNQDFALYAKDLAELPAPKVIIGDFNCTPWSYYFQKLASDTGLVDAERGFGQKFTWSYRGLLFPVLPIDLCLVSPETVVSRVTVEEDVSSDHRPLLVEIWVPARH